jgi:hypothetical protein
MSDEIRTRPATDEYREGWERTFGREGDMCESVCDEEPRVGARCVYRRGHPGMPSGTAHFNGNGAEWGGEPRVMEELRQAHLEGPGVTNESFVS